MSDVAVKQETPRKKAWRLDEASRASGLSRSYLYKLEKLGKIKLIRIGGRTLLADAELDRLLKSGGDAHGAS